MPRRASDTGPWPSALLAAPLDVELHRGVAHLGTMLLDKALPDALGGVPLLMPTVLVLIQVALDDALVGIEN